MKKILLLVFSILIMCSTVWAQETTNYLAKAFELLLEGNVESAEKHYIVHKKLTGQTDADFEAMLEGEKGKSSESWKDECYIVPLDTVYMLAVQKASITEVTELSQSNAELAASASRLGGFMDWHLPDDTEMSVLIANLPLNTIKAGWYWTSITFTGGRGKSITWNNSHEIENSTVENDYVIVRKFLRK